MLECDLIMKGGITSGVVYPKAVTTIAKKYRLRDIGGTSAGAIAAVVAAAAEYRRQSGGGDAGYDEVENLATELGPDMGSFFQPSPDTARLYGVFIAVVGREQGRAQVSAALIGVAKSYGVLAAAGGALAAGLLVLLLWGVGAGVGLGGGIAAVILFDVVALTLIVLMLVRDLMRASRNSDFGLCPGKTQPGFEKPAITNWLADKIDFVAGRDVQGDPLTHGELRGFKINVATMTTDLASRRPYQLPLLSKDHYFSKAEFDRLFPARVVEYLVRQGKRLKVSQPDVPDDLYQLPHGDDFPVILTARFSLSFPGLFSAVPLWRHDRQLPKRDGQPQLARCLFSDGGISSNFPVHLFDAPLPRRPTFGIALAEWEQDRHGATRVFLPKRGSLSNSLPVRPPKGPLGFLGSILNTSKDWQDTLQSLLPGTADRIVEIRLDKDMEGGMNLKMQDDTVNQLIAFGEEAGQALVKTFDFDEHRWQRGLTFLPTMHEMLGSLNEAYGCEPYGTGAQARDYASVLREYEPVSYGNNTRKWRKDVLEPYARALADQGRSDGTGAGLADGKSLPNPDASVRLVADANRAPRRS